MIDLTVGFQTNWQTNIKSNQEELLFQIPFFQNPKSRKKEPKIANEEWYIKAKNLKKKKTKKTKMIQMNHTNLPETSRKYI